MGSPKMVSINGQLLVDSNDGSGTRWPVADNDPLRATFGLFLPNLAPAATPTDLITISGSATKITRIRSIVITGTATAASNIQVSLVHRTSANTGGTFTAQALTNRDRTDDAPTSTLNLYTANPTGLGTPAGVVDGGRLNLAPAANGGIDRLLLQYGWLNDKAPTLRLATDILAINLGGIAWPAGGNLDVAIVLTEDAIP